MENVDDDYTDNVNDMNDNGDDNDDDDDDENDEDVDDDVIIWYHIIWNIPILRPNFINYNKNIL